MIIPETPTRAQILACKKKRVPTPPHNKGADNPHARIKEPDVHVIRFLGEIGVTEKYIAQIYGYKSTGAINHIKTGVTWPDVPQMHCLGLMDKPLKSHTMKHGSSHLGPGDVHVIRWLTDEIGVSKKEIEKHFNLKTGSAYKIVTRESWKHLPELTCLGLQKPPKKENLLDKLLNKTDVRYED